MKNFFFILTCWLFATCLSFSQEYGCRFGEITLQELQMEKYPYDSAAQAVVLYKTGNTHYKFIDNRLQTESHYETKIKILTSRGTTYADVTIPFYEPEKGWAVQEYISQVEAYAYNLENGETVCTELDKKYIFEERLSPWWKQLKFSIPAVKAGTVVEYRYTKTSFLHNVLDSWQIQEFIPVAYAHYEILIPEFIRFHARTTGSEPIHTEEQVQEQGFSFRLGNNKTKPIVNNSRRLKFTSTYVPALDTKNFVWCLRDYVTGIDFEFQEMRLLNSYYPPYSASWEKVDKTLKKSFEFGKCLSMKNPYRKVMKEHNLDSLDNKGKIRFLFRFLQDKMAWDGNYGLGGAAIKEAVKNGKGSNAEFNFILLSLLRDAGIQAYPVLLRLRQLGELSLTRPEINNFTTFIVGARDTDSTFIYMDGSMTYGDINMLSPDLLVKRARVLDVKNGSFWVDLSRTGRNRTQSIIEVHLDEEGNIQGTRRTHFEGIFAAAFNKRFAEKKDSMEFIRYMQTHNDIVIDSFQRWDTRNMSDSIQEKIYFHKQTEHNQNLVYLNPMIFPHLTDNPFTEEKCNLPVEMDFPYTYQIDVNLDLPENYAVEEIPLSDSILLENGDAICHYQLNLSDRKIKLRYLFRLNKSFYNPTEYPLLKKFWEAVVQKNNEQMVLKSLIRKLSKPKQND